MKKFLLIAAIGVAGLVSAKSSDIKEKEEVKIKTEKFDINKLKNQKEKVLLAIRYSFYTTCGTSISFTSERKYSDEQLFELMDLINYLQCDENIDSIEIDR